ncbi:FAD-dependent oxidoreductase [Microcella daejeonensis]|uniref:FAD-dependent oxidoreductase n=1 Tax=Microcella daejeonensis TaxID=2994971 RepID=UPI00226DECEC|nr:FAD-dependent oxidoreductase [Microcella daejeonensis]WAB84365.1 FAD-dependent oxidoreductase [Microcella daejeonensis]
MVSIVRDPARCCGRRTMSARPIQVDVVVVGLGLGAIAATLVLAARGVRVAMIGPESRIGGQVTTQLTSPLDEHPLIETAGCTARYRAFRDAVRAEYGGVPNPGGGWVSRVCFEPSVGERVLQRMLAPHVDSGSVTVIPSARPIAVRIVGSRAEEVTFVTRDGEFAAIGAIVIDATETGELLPLSDTAWVIGSEGRDAYGEPHALPGAPDSRAEQSCTIVAALVREPSPQSAGVPPARYGQLRDAQPYSFTLSNDERTVQDFAMYDDAVAPGSFWSYRRVRDPRLIGGADTAIINWHGNDYVGSGLVAQPAETEAGARQLAAGFVHWLRTEAPRDDGGRGHPELRLAPEVSGTADGYAESPYVRESRRLRSTEPVTEHDLMPRAGIARALMADDSVGTAWYHADLHPRVGGHPSVYAPTAPFTIPLTALVPQPGRGPKNLIAGAKNLAATQVAAAAYRVHPGEWAVGEAAGVLAAEALQGNTEPADLARDERGTLAVQIGALRAGAPIFWATDLPHTHPAFLAGSLLAAHGGLDDARRATLSVMPDAQATPEARRALLAAAQTIAARWGVALDPDATESETGITWGSSRARWPTRC